MPNSNPTLQSEIKDIVITKLLDQICLQFKELAVIKEENTSLKRKLTILCKRMITSTSKTSCCSPIKVHTFSTPKKNMSIKTKFLSNRSSSKSRQSSLELPFKCKSPLKSNFDCRSDRYTKGEANQINETQMMFMSTRDRINSSSYGMSLDSTNIPNGSFSPRQINDYYQYQKRKQLLSKKSPDVSDSACETKGKRMRIIKQRTIEKVDEKHQMKVTMLKNKKR